MIYRQRWAQSRSLSEVLALALALATLMFILVILPSRSASALTLPKADYRFQNTPNSSVGTAPALTDIPLPNTNTFPTAMVDGASRTVLGFPKSNGVQLSDTTGVVSNGTYTIVALFEFDDLVGFKRIVDFKNGTSDRGLYFFNGKLTFYQNLGAGSTTIAANNYVQVVLTRDASSKEVVGYVDGVQQFSFTDTNNDAVISAKNTLRFFRDNESSGGATGEDSPGSVARIRLYNTALNDDEVGALDRREPSTFVVNSTGDENDLNFPSGVSNGSPDSKCDVNASASGNQCSLRAAIQQANAISGKDTINFNIAGTGVKTVAVASELPPITGAVTINGYSQPNASPNTKTVGTDAVLLIELNGQNAVRSGLRLDASDSTIKGLVINRFTSDGIYAPGNDNIIEGNYIGTDASGTTDQGNGLYGVEIGFSSSNNTVGGTTAASRNLISGNSASGVLVSGSNNTVKGNYIGTNASGTASLGNSFSGVNLFGSSTNNVVGGTTSGARNVISGNSGDGVNLSNGPNNCRIEGNYIGTNASGTAALGNGLDGVEIFQASNNVVGGTNAGARNVISRNQGDGVYIDGSAATGNRIVRNSIFNNGKLGINLDGGTQNVAGVTANDPGDADTGDNGLLNRPVLTSAETSGGQTTIKGYLDKTTNEAIDLQFFASPVADPSRFGEGKTFLGEKTDVFGDPDARVNFSVTLPTPVAAGQVVTAIATDTFTNDYSEFSNAVAVQ